MVLSILFQISSFSTINNLEAKINHLKQQPSIIDLGKKFANNFITYGTGPNTRDKYQDISTEQLLDELIKVNEITEEHEDEIDTMVSQVDIQKSYFEWNSDYEASVHMKMIVYYQLGSKRTSSEIEVSVICKNTASGWKVDQYQVQLTGTDQKTGEWQTAS